MITDYQILGIEPTNDASVIRSAYRKRVKETHPDIAKIGNAFQNHILFIQITKAYQRLISHAKMSPLVRNSYNDKKQNSAAITLYKDPAYSYYKQGMKYFIKIHPSEWKLESHRMLESLIPGNENDKELIKNKVKNILSTFPKAYYYFSIVANEYPESEWSFDAKEKMKIIESRTDMYKKIIESFDKL